MSREGIERGERTAMITTVATFLLAVGKAVAGLLSGSVVLITDAAHSGADLFPILASWFGLRIAQRDPDEKFPYGYYKAESLATLIVSIFLIYVALEFVLKGYSKVFSASAVPHPYLAGGVALASIAASALISRYQKKVGEETNSASLVANSKESLADVFSSCLVFAAVFLSHYGIAYAEGLATMVISVFVFKIGGESLRNSIYGLMDISPGRELRERVEGTLDGVPGVENVKSVRCRKAGPFILGDLTIEARGFLDVGRAHEITERVETRIRGEIEDLESLVVHVEPSEKSKVTLAMPIDEDGGPDSEVSNHFGRAEYFAVVTVDLEEGEITDLEVCENRYGDRESKSGLYAAHDLLKREVDYLVSREIGEISFHTLRDHMIGVYRFDGGTVGEAVERYMDGGLERFFEPSRDEDSPEPS